MPRHLVIVESPAKARTLGRQLGRDYVVRASLGHVRDLPRHGLGIDLARGFQPAYEVLPGRRRVLAELAAAARDADTVFLAADPDREGEAICWHLQQALGGAPRRFRRVAFHELTPRAVAQAFAAPREVDARRVDAQQARRLLDRLVGYSLSPLLWQKVPGGLSAGRVQSVALRILCDRERERIRFQPEERFLVRATLEAAAPPVFTATLAAIGGREARLATAADAEGAVDALGRCRFRVLSLTERPRRRPPAPPFITSSLQQEAFRRLRFGVKKTMQLAQQLYEGKDLGDGPVGLITYMRTDSPRVAPEAAEAARGVVARAFGPEYLPQSPHAIREGAAAQGAHEAIRPTDLARAPETLRARLSADELALYTLVYERFLASQMAAAAYDDTFVEVAADPSTATGPAPAFTLRAKGSALRFRGFLAAHEESPEEDAPREALSVLPPLREGQELSLAKAFSEHRRSEPPPRFSEASLVKELERCGVGRPSTYAAVVATLVDRRYVARAKGRLEPTPLGFAVTDLLVARFPELLSVGYTASLEQQLDAIEAGRETLLATLAGFWERFATALEAARREPAAGRPPRPDALVRPARPEGPDVACPRCHTGRVVERHSGERLFYGCSRFPACRFTSSRRPLAESCPECGEPCLFEKETKRDGRVVFCGSEACHFHRSG